MTYPQGYQITWGTYGTRLPGSEKPHVTKAQNVYQTPLPLSDQWKELDAHGLMMQGPVHLTREHRMGVEQSIIDVADRYQWTVHAIAPQSDHVHVVISAMRIGQKLRDALKAVAARQLNAQFVKQKWWPQGGSCKYLYERDYFLNAVNYVRRQRDW